jgi:S-DNA-T family DNA segregation ATPase FtsK/SpoIIIE
VNLSDNIALALAATQVRIVAPIPGKSAVGVEIPNRKRDIIGFREILPYLTSSLGIPMVLGRSLMGEPVVVDVVKAPHLLIAGSTGSGKSVCVNSLICSVLFRRSPKQVRMILVDPKIVELNIYNGIPHLLTPVITDAKKTLKALDFCLYEMERRYKLLQALSVRNIIGYNEKIESSRLAREKLPYILVVIDEFADLMHLVGKDMESKVSRLAAMSRAVGIHLVLATQRPSVDVITGVIKNNIPTRIAFAVTSSTDSRIILDEPGADKLLGKGDMLYMSSSSPATERIQGSFLSDNEVEQVVAFVSSQGEPEFIDESFFEDDEPKASESSDDEGADSNDDEALMDRALAIVVERKCASASYLQRRLKIGYNRAARMVEQMEELGYVGPPNGSKPRELIKYP